MKNFSFTEVFLVYRSFSETQSEAFYEIIKKLLITRNIINKKYHPFYEKSNYLYLKTGGNTPEK